MTESRAERLTEAQASPDHAKVARVQSCTATLVIVTESLHCYLTDGHAGPHKGVGNGGVFWWQYERMHR